MPSLPLGLPKIISGTFVLAHDAKAQQFIDNFNKQPLSERARLIAAEGGQHMKLECGQQETS